jgi:hypothetical protein
MMTLWTRMMWIYRSYWSSMTAFLRPAPAAKPGRFHWILLLGSILWYL